MTPEMDWLDQLLGSDESLYVVLQVFDRHNDIQALGQAQHSVLMQIEEGLIQLKEKQDDVERVLPVWECRRVIRTDASRLKQETNYFPGLTVKGEAYVG